LSVPTAVFMALICTAEPTRDTEMPTSTAGRVPDLNRSSWRKIWPSVIEITLVGMYAETSPALTVGLGLLGKVVVDDESVLAVVHPVLAHGTACVWSDVLERCGVRCWCDDDDRVVHGAVGFELGHDLGNGRGLLADRHIDALHVETLLVQDRVDADGRLAGLAVANDQLSLASANRNERVDGLNARLHWGVHRLTADDARCLHLHTAALGAGERALAVDGLAERVDDTAKNTSVEPRSTAPIDSSSRFSARPTAPFSNSSISLTAASGNPDTRAIPSPTSSTRPTWVASSVVSRPSMFFLRAAAMSWVLMVRSDIVSFLLRSGLAVKRGSRASG